jgi:hypothetical protein
MMNPKRIVKVLSILLLVASPMVLGGWTWYERNGRLYSDLHPFKPQCDYYRPFPDSNYVVSDCYDNQPVIDGALLGLWGILGNGFHNHAIGPRYNNFRVYNNNRGPVYSHRAVRPHRGKNSQVSGRVHAGGGRHGHAKAGGGRHGGAGHAKAGGKGRGGPRR